MLIQIHAIQNHSPANLNRDDLGAPKTCFFGGVLRSRISSQCLKRSIRMSPEFQDLLGGVRTRQLARLIAERIPDQPDVQKRAERVLGACGFKLRDKKKKTSEEAGETGDSEKSKMLVYTTKAAIEEMAALLKDSHGMKDQELAVEFAKLIAGRTAVPDMALSGRMLEPESAGKVWKGLNNTVEAALQVAHAISTHEARPEVDYYVATDDIPGDDAGAGYVDEAMFASACFYKYSSIDWDTLVRNLDGFPGNKEHLAAHTIGAFIRGSALVTPTGKQNSFAAHNPPDGMLVEFRNTPMSYANAFARPAERGARDLVSQSIAQLGQYVNDLDAGYGRPPLRFWFSPNLRYALVVSQDKSDINLADASFKSLDELVSAVVRELGYQWEDVCGCGVGSEGVS